MRAALESGVTTVRSAGVSHFVDVGLRELVSKGFVAGPDVIAAGYHVRPGVAPELFIDFPDLGDLMGGVTRRRGAAARGARRTCRAASTGSRRSRPNAPARPTPIRASRSTRRRSCASSSSKPATKDTPVMAHAHGAEGADAAVRAGVRSIEHGTYLTDETLQMMAKQGTYFDPTADIVNDLAEPGGDYDNAALKRRGEMMQPILKAAIGKRAQVRREDRGGLGHGLRPEQRRAGRRAKRPSWSPRA